MGNLFGREPANLSQRERNLCVTRQGRVATREDQTQPIVRDTLAVLNLRSVIDLQLPRQVTERSIEPDTPPNRIDPFEPARRNQPRPRIAGHAFARPLLDRRGESVVHRLFGQVKIPQQPDQRRQHVARFAAIDSVHHLSRFYGRSLAHGTNSAFIAGRIDGASATHNWLSPTID